jgi:hypothetical protein
MVDVAEHNLFLGNFPKWDVEVCQEFFIILFVVSRWEEITSYFLNFIQPLFYIGDRLSNSHMATM